MKQENDIALDPSAGTAPTDTQRLDWAAARGVYLVIEMDCQYKLGRKLEAGEAVQRNKYPTVRAAIDAAMNGTDPLGETEA